MSNRPVKRGHLFKITMVNNGQMDGEVIIIK